MNDYDISALINRIKRLEDEVFGKKVNITQNNTKASKKIKNPPLDFSLNIRAFVKKFATKKSGAKKFVLLLAFLTKEEVGKDITLAEIQREWNKMSGKGMLGKFNRFYPNSAKTQGWINSKKSGIYCLANSWKEAYE